MFKNYFIVALRYLAKHKGYTLINALGLSVGIACCILIMLFVRSEWSYDRFHSKADRIHRAWLQENYEGQVFTNTVTPIPLGPVLQANLPEVESICRVYSLNPLVRYNNHVFTEPVNMVDSSFFNLFDFAFVQGNVKNALATGNSIVLTETAAKKYFGKEPALGKNIELQLSGEWVPFTISSIVKEVPLESSIQFEMLFSFANARRFFSEAGIKQAWSSVSLETYVLLKEGAMVSTANSKIPAIMNPLVAKNYKPGEYKVALQPLTDIHLNNTLPAGNVPISNPKYSLILGTVGILILLIACINFVTLSIGRSATRSMEVGVRKVLGAERRQLISQFWGEALLLTFFSVIMGVIIALLCLKPFNQIADRELSLNMDGITIFFTFVLFLIVGVIAGIYPAIILSGFRPIEVLKGKINASGKMSLFRRGLVVAQFVASIIMITSTFIIGKQLSFLRDKDLGYNKEHVVVVPTNKSSRQEGIELAKRFRTAIETNPQVKASTTSWFSFIESGWMNIGFKDGTGAYRMFRMNQVDADFIPTMGLQLIAGRNFNKENIGDSNAVIINEAMVREYGLKDPIGKKLPGNYAESVIGVVKDFHFESLHTPVKPMLLTMRADSILNASSDVSSEFSTSRKVTVRLMEGDLQAQMAFLKSKWKTVAGDQDFNYSFLDESLFLAYQQELRLGRVVRYASFLSIFIACLGLFGLVTLVVNKRTKEIGIRKVLGAEVKSIVALLSKDFVVLVILASLIAFPITWWAVNKWLQDFAYRIDVPLWAFIVATFIALSIAIITVSIQAIKAALMNPVKSLRTE